MKNLTIDIEKMVSEKPVDKDNFLEWWKFCKKTRRTLRSIESDIESILLRAKKCDD